VEGGAFLDEFQSAGFSSVTVLRRHRNARAKNPNVTAVDVCARK